MSLVETIMSDFYLSALSSHWIETTPNNWADFECRDIHHGKQFPE